LPDEDAAADMLAECGARLATAGFVHYEVSAYARPGRECRHNLNYWTFGDYVGIGAGAHGKLTLRGRIVRTTQLREPRRYVAGSAAELVRHTVPEQDLPFEFMLNALRLTSGFARETFCDRTGLAWRSIEGPVALALERGLLVATESGYRPSALGLRFLNDVLLLFMAEKLKKPGNSTLSIAS
jgi:oxygen-independent coproporphyrinogen-3 oxidase